MWCSNPNCLVEELPVKWLGPDEWMIGTYHVAASAPICTSCGENLEPNAPSMIERDSIVLFLHQLAG